jgi:hypothetical protein
VSATAIIDALERDGWSEVERMIGAREPETVHLDFKRIEGGVSTPLCDDDLGHVAKAVSAFANVEGGVLLLGVNAKGKGKEPDRADGVVHIEKVDAAAAQLERFAPTLTDPPVPGLRVRPIEDPNRPKAGVIAIYAPQSDGGPHQAARGDGKARYFMRTAANSEPMPHSILAGMFGRAPPPSLVLSARLNFERQIVLSVENRGRGLAENIMLRFTISTLDNGQVFSAQNTGPFWREWQPSVQVLGDYLHILTHDLVVHAADASPAWIFGENRFEEGFKINARVDARGMAPVLVKATVGRISIAEPVTILGAQPP